MNAPGLDLAIGKPGDRRTLSPPAAGLLDLVRARAAAAARAGAGVVPHARPAVRSRTASSRRSSATARWSRRRWATRPSTASFASRRATAGSARTFRHHAHRGSEAASKISTRTRSNTPARTVSRWLPEILGWIIPLVLLIAVWSFFFRRIGGAEGGVMSFARSRAKIYADDDVKVSFQDVAGVDEAEDELRGDRRVPEEPQEVHDARRAHSEGRAAGRPAGNRQDAAGARRRRRSEGPVLLAERVGVRRDVRRRRRRARPRSLLAGRIEIALHRVHRRARRARARSGCRARWAVTKSASRR